MKMMLWLVMVREVDDGTTEDRRMRSVGREIVGFGC
jgi:hypothetical protein